MYTCIDHRPVTVSVISMYKLNNNIVYSLIGEKEFSLRNNAMIDLLQQFYLSHTSGGQGMLSI